MKKLIAATLTFSLALITTLAPVLAQPIFGGEKISYNIPLCEQLTVNITPCEDGEWKVDNCNSTEVGIWYCDCSDNYVLNLTPAVNAVGTYDLEISYTYLAPEPTKETVTFEYIPPIGVIYKDITLNVTKTVEHYFNQTAEPCEYNTTKIEELENKTIRQEKEIERLKNTNEWQSFGLAMALAAVFGTILYYSIMKIDKKKEVKENEKKY